MNGPLRTRWPLGSGQEVGVVGGETLRPPSGFLGPWFDLGVTLLPPWHDLGVTLARPWHDLGATLAGPLSPPGAATLTLISESSFSSVSSGCVLCRCSSAVTSTPCTPDVEHSYLIIKKKKKDFIQSLAFDVRQIRSDTFTRLLNQFKFYLSIIRFYGNWYFTRL